MPVSSPDTTIPTFLPLFSGRENWEAIGMNICGITEQMPVRSEAHRMTWMLGAIAITSNETINMEKLVRMIRFR